MKREMPKDSAEYNAFMAAWNFWKNFGTPENDEKYWEAVIAYSADCTNNKRMAEAKDLVAWLCRAVADVLDARMKSIKQYGDEKHGYEILMKSLDEDNKRFTGKVLREKRNDG